MQSILSNFLLLETSLHTRLTSSFDWTVTAAGSSTAAYLLKPDSANKNDRMYEAKGGATWGELGEDQFNEILDIWAAHNDEFGELFGRFQHAQRDQRRRGKQAQGSRATTLAEWAPRQDQLSHKEKRWTRMTGSVQVPCTNLVPCTLYLSALYTLK
jgi:hypothetical protein